MAEQLNPELQDALQEAGAGERSSRSAARSVAGVMDMARCLVWLKALMMVGGLLVALNIGMLGRVFVLSDRISENTAQVAVLSTRVTELTRRVENLEEGVENLEEGQRKIIEQVAELRRGQDELMALLRTRLSESDPGEIVPENPAAPGVSTAPRTPSPPQKPNP